MKILVSTSGEDIEVNGFKISLCLLKALAEDPTPRWAQIYGREDGMITLRSPAPDLSRTFDSLLALELAKTKTKGEVPG